MSLLFNDVLTIYNRYLSAPQPPRPPEPMYSRTIIRNCSWKNRSHTNPNTDGKAQISQTVSITIPLEAITDKKFISPQEFRNADKELYWTLNVDPSNPDIICLGEAPEIDGSYTVSNLRSEFKVMNVLSVSDTHEQGVLPQWKVDGV